MTMSMEYHIVVEIDEANLYKLLGGEKVSTNLGSWPAD